MNREKCILNCLKNQKKIAKIIDWYEKKGDYILCGVRGEKYKIHLEKAFIQGEIILEEK